MIGDAYRALELLATHPRIDSARIAVMGFSKGGAVALYAALTRFRRLHGPSAATFAHHIAFYPPCSYAFVGNVGDRSPDPDFPGDGGRPRPHRAVPSLCGAARRAGADAQITEYAGAHHGFDRPGDATTPQSPRAECRPLLLGRAPGRSAREPGLRAAIQPDRPVRGPGRDQRR